MMRQAGVEGEIIEREPAALGSRHEVHRYLRAVEKTVVGFCWSWPPEDGRSWSPEDGR